ncbi:HlyD family efflux transporter periplasmic adaptor subunit [Roseibium sp. M-1]
MTAPVAGIVHELSVFTIGGVIGPGDPVLQIIPQDGNYEIEASIEPQFVDELHPGQAARQRFSAFNQRTTPEIEGVLKTVSANVVVNEQTGQSFYRFASPFRKPGWLFWAITHWFPGCPSGFLSRPGTGPHSTILLNR